MKKCLMMMLLIALLMPVIYATPQEQGLKNSNEPTLKELYETIEPNEYYTGETVQQMAMVLIYKAYKDGYIKGAAAAARPLLVENAGLKAWQNEAKKKLTNNVYKTIFFVACGVVSGYVTGIIIANVR